MANEQTEVMEAWKDAFAAYRNQFSSCMRMMRQCHKYQLKYYEYRWFSLVTRAYLHIAQYRTRFMSRVPHQMDRLHSVMDQLDYESAALKVHIQTTRRLSEITSEKIRMAKSIMPEHS